MLLTPAYGTFGLPSAATYGGNGGARVGFNFATSAPESCCSCEVSSFCVTKLLDASVSYSVIHSMIGCASDEPLAEVSDDAGSVVDGAISVVWDDATAAARDAACAVPAEVCVAD
jgi:hypothetical protein